MSLDGDHWYEMVRRPTAADYEDLYAHYVDPDRRFDPVHWAREFVERVADGPIEEIEV